jgi:hypothetical protein
MKYYTLNPLGQAEVTRAVMDACSQHAGINPSAFFKDAEEAMNSNGDYQNFEIGRRYTDSKNPELVDVLPEWFDSEISDEHQVLASFLLKKLEDAPASDTLREFFTDIDEPAARDASQNLIAQICGVNVTKEKGGDLHRAVQQVLAVLEELGVPNGDWAFVPVFNSFENREA